MPVAPRVDRRRAFRQINHVDGGAAGVAEARDGRVDAGGAVGGTVRIDHQDACHASNLPLSPACSVAGLGAPGFAGPGGTLAEDRQGLAIPAELSRTTFDPRATSTLRDKDTPDGSDTLAAGPHDAGAALAGSAAGNRTGPRPSGPVSGLRADPSVLRFPARRARMRVMPRSAGHRARRRRAALLRYPDHRAHHHPLDADRAEAWRPQHAGDDGDLRAADRGNGDRPAAPGQGGRARRAGLDGTARRQCRSVMSLPPDARIARAVPDGEVLTRLSPTL